MKTLLLLRHAKSSWTDPLDDHDRPLSGRGGRAARAMAEHMASQGLVPDRVLCSSAVRTSETWALMAPHLGEPPLETSRTLYLASPGELLAAVRAGAGDAERLLLVGHNPGIEELARALAGSGDEDALRRLRRKFPTGALAVLRLASDAWTDLAPATAELVEFVRPKDLPDAKRLGL
jgi:phosphohistidine phosphatase